jgi:large subunit ribosomal protein L17
MFKNMICSLIEHEKIKTTLPKAKELRPLAEKVITLGKRFLASSEAERLHIRRQAISRMGSEESANRLFALAERLGDRHGGYLRIVKAGHRYGDNAPMAFVCMVDEAAGTAVAIE